MTAREYLSQAYRLDQKINSDIEEATRLREIITEVSAPQLGEQVQTSPSGDPPFVRSIEKIIELEKTIDQEIDLYVDLKKQMRDVISCISDTDEQMVLRYRYIHNYTWERIGRIMHADSRTVRRWHENALDDMFMPKNPIKI